MLLYLATAPLLPPCLKIAVNYKCSLNVSSDPEMQVGVRRRDWASPSLKRPRHYFFPSLSCFLQSFLSPLTPPSPHPPQLPLLCLLHSPPLHSCFSIPLVFLYISLSPSLALPFFLRGISSALWEWAGLGDRGFGSFSPTHERAAARHWRPWLWNRFSLQIVCASHRVFVYLSSTSSSYAAAGVGCWKERHVKVR